MPDYHAPVMLHEVLDYLQPQPGYVIIDCTLGGAGHSVEIVKKILPNGRLIGIDRDDDALKAASERLSQYSENVTLAKGNFADLQAIADRLGIKAVNGILFDLGVSSHQLDEVERGFSFKSDAPLDMRMDKSQPLTARELINTLSKQQLTDIIWKYGEERWAKRIAEYIVDRRARGPIQSTSDLVETILAAVPTGARSETIHPATRTFQAIRIAVNGELDSLQTGLDTAVNLLANGGRICVLSYHSLEDRIVKSTFIRFAGRCSCPPGFPVCVCGAKKQINILTKRPVLPSDEEVNDNPRARSAKLRAAEKIT
ncbi:MAG: 16S rRNA (cytosine(1402)-N(4))-methyltransferase RsmH [Armatimonadota bacterium]